MRSCLSDFQVVVPGDLEGVLKMLSQQEGWRPLAGGTDLMVLLNAGKLPFRKLVSLRNIAELTEIRVSKEKISIGAAVTYSQIQAHPLLLAEFPLLCQAASWTGGVANQNQGTLGGNIANGSPAADSAPPLLVHDAALQIVSASGTRSVPYSEFHLGYKQFAMQSDELIYAVELPRRSPGWRYRGRKVGTRRAQAISKISFAAGAILEEGRIVSIRLALASVAPVPLRCSATERVLAGAEISATTLAHGRRALQTDIRPIDDLRSTAVYRSQVAQNLLQDFLESLR